MRGGAEWAANPWQVRREQRIGNWGRASEHIGKRWEEVGVLLLRELLEGRRPWPLAGARPVGWVELAVDPAIQTAFSRLSLPSPDVVVALRAHGVAPFLQAVDFKWHVEFASYRQISATTLRELLAHDVGDLTARLEARAFPCDETVEYRDGLLFAPDIPSNHAFLTSPQNRNQDYPIQREDVVFASVEGQQFFGPLPGWDMALLLADYDDAPRVLHNIDGAERYYRLGAGLQGAVAQLTSSIFLETPPPAETSTAFAWLTSTYRLRPTGVLAQRVEQDMAARSQLLARLKELLRSPYRLSELRGTLRRRGLALPLSIEEDSDLGRRSRELLKQVSLSHKAAVRQAGLDLVHRGESDARALATLARQTPHFLALARANADRLADQIWTDEP
ncbi:MAG: hypothetical protein ACYC4L_19245 [Chloroflexota bacterium]